jgi:Brp/Blh family beta-carotene 15,15'-monooxygenase
VLGLGMFLVWHWLPILALIIFLTYTAWHFGQADFHHWGMKSSIGAFLWGTLLLSVILLGHWQQTTEILTLMKVPAPKLNLPDLVSNWWAFILFTGGIFILGRLLKVNKFILETILVLFFSWQLPLLSAFGLYFIFQHSWHGWTFLERQLESNFIQLWKKGTLFTFGAILFFVIFILSMGSQHLNWGTFFIFLSALSFPHVAYMHLFYLRRS